MEQVKSKSSIITQEQVDTTFLYLINEENSLDQFRSEKLIQKFIKEELNLDISLAEAHFFWCWRSRQYEANFLHVYDESSSKKKCLQVVSGICD